MPEKQTEIPSGEANIKPEKLRTVIRRGSWVVYQNNYDAEPCPALVTHVWPNEGERLLNLTIFDRDGEARGATRIYRGNQVGTWRPVDAKD